MPFFLKKIFNRRKEKKSVSPSMMASVYPLGNPVWSSCHYEDLTREGYVQNPIVNRCVRLIAETAASVPLGVVCQHRKEDRHPVSAFLKRPNGDQTFSELLENHFGYLQVSGNAYLRLVSLEGEPCEIRTLRPDYVQVLATRTGEVSGWLYKTGGEQRRFQCDRFNGRQPIFHMKHFHPSIEAYGLSPIEIAARAIDIYNAGACWNKALLDNAARPSGALVYKGAQAGDLLNDTQFSRLKEQLATLYQGGRNAGRPLLLDGGLEWTSMSLSPADMDFIEGRREAARDIARAFGVPPMLLGIPGDNPYSNFKEANLAFWRSIVLPLVRKTALSLTHWLQPWFEETFEIIAEEQSIPALAEERSLQWSRLDTTGFLTREEKRKMAGLPPLSSSEIAEEKDMSGK